MPLAALVPEIGPLVSSWPGQLLCFGSCCVSKYFSLIWRTCFSRGRVFWEGIQESPVLSCTKSSCRVRDQQQLERSSLMLWVTIEGIGYEALSYPGPSGTILVILHHPRGWWDVVQWLSFHSCKNSSRSSYLEKHCFSEKYPKSVLEIILF